MPIIVHPLKLIGADTFEDNAQQTSSRIEVMRYEYMSGSPAVLQQIQRPHETYNSFSRLMHCCLCATYYSENTSFISSRAMYTRRKADTRITLLVPEAALGDYSHIMGCIVDSDVELAAPSIF